jgi:tungstate transport system substrate-binding protein
VNAQQRPAFIDWLVPREGQNAVAEYRINGRQPFFPNAPRS